jgi:hypothetical protein
VQRIDRPTVQTHNRIVAILFDEGFATLMAPFAQTLELAREKLIAIAVMRFNVISDRCRHDPVAAFQTEPTQWVFAQLMPAPSLPVR